MIGKVETVRHDGCISDVNDGINADVAATREWIKKNIVSGRSSAFGTHMRWKNHI